MNRLFNMSPSSVAEDIHQHPMPQFDKYAQQILQSGKSHGHIGDATALPAPRSFDSFTPDNGYFGQFGSSFLKSILPDVQNRADIVPSVFGIPGGHSHIQQFQPTMDIEFAPNRIVIDSSNFETLGQHEEQLKYDKFMSDVWIAITLIMILIILVFFMCSCFLYYQYRSWRRSYLSSLTGSQNLFDAEAQKLACDPESQAPEYSLVSGLPSYEAALELMGSSSQPCFVVYPNVFSVYSRGRVAGGSMRLAAALEAPSKIEIAALHHSEDRSCEAATPLLLAANETTAPDVTISCPTNEKLELSATTAPQAASCAAATDSMAIVDNESGLMEINHADKC